MTTPEPTRDEWADVAKGIAIILVVLYHSALLSMQAGIAPDTWGAINADLEAFRMPLFFFASGLFAQSAVRRSWRGLWSSRLALLLWAFVLWSVLRFVYFTAVPMESRPEETEVLRLLLGPVWPTSGLWFLQALFVFLVLAKLTSRIPVWVMLAGAAVMSAAFLSFATVGNLSYNGMARYFLFFLLGLYGRAIAKRYTVRANPLLAVAAVLAFAAALTVVDTLGARRVPGVMVVLGVLAVFAGVLTSRVLADVVARRPLAYLGRKTLPIYVTHVPLVAACLAACGAIGVGTQAGAFLPLLIAATVITVSLALARAVRDVPVLRYLYEVPPALARAERSTSRRATPTARQSGA